MSTGEGNGPRERALAKGFFHVIFVLQRRATTRLISISRSRESRRFVATLVPDRAGNRRATNRGPLGCIIVGFGFYFTLIMFFFFIYIAGNISKKLWIFQDILEIGIWRIFHSCVGIFFNFT